MITSPDPIRLNKTVLLRRVGVASGDVITKKLNSTSFCQVFGQSVNSENFRTSFVELSRVGDVITLKTCKNWQRLVLTQFFGD
jgi:hypothetical protein